MTEAQTNIRGGGDEPEPPKQVGRGSKDPEPPKATEDKPDSKQAGNRGSKE